MDCILIAIMVKAELQSLFTCGPEELGTTQAARCKGEFMTLLRHTDMF